jgi:anti-anti-sigma factor
MRGPCRFAQARPERNTPQRCGLQYLDSSGVGELVQCYLSVIKLGGEMKVAGPNRKIEEIFKKTMLSRIFPEFNDGV